MAETKNHEGSKNVEIALPSVFSDDQMTLKNRGPPQLESYSLPTGYLFIISILGRWRDDVAFFKGFTPHE